LTGLKPMVNHATSTLDLTNQQEAARVLPQPPLVASYHTGWKGLTFTHYCHPPHETVEHGLLQHSLVITDSKSCFQAERHLDGKFKHYAHGNGRVDVIPAFLSHSTNWDREVEFSVIAICPTLLNQTTQELMQVEIELIPQLAIDDPVIHQLALALKLEIQTGCMSGRLYGELLGTALAARLVQNYAVSKPALEFKASGLPQSQLARVIDYMKANLTQDLSILDLATLTGMSESHFSRSFKRSVGISPYQYLMQQRVERAKQLLEQRSLALAKPLPCLTAGLRQQQKPPGTGIAISTIALDCGFANQTHLTKVFRQMTGMTPKAYQK
jgi:AraC family transcriptional regulator